MAQENINFGAYPNDINSDAIRTAFEKAQNNFTELYGISTSFGVNSVTPGTGVTVSAPSGDITLNANIFNIQLKTQSMVLGPSAFVTTSGPNSTVTITNSGTPITIEMPANITGTSLSVTGNVNAGNVVTAGVVINSVISSTGNVTAPYFLGNVIGNVSGNLTVGGSNTQVLFNDNNLANATSGFTFNKTTNAVNITGNANIGNVGATLFVGNLSGTGNSNVGNIGATLFVGTLSGAATTAGTVTTAAQPNITSVGTLTSLSVSGNANVGNIGATSIVGTLTTASQTNITSVGTLGSLSVSGNANIGNVGATLFVGTLSGAATTAGTVTTAAQPNITSVGTLSSLSVSGNANVGNIGATNIVGTLSTAAQPNITSVGTLSSLSVSGNVTYSSYVVDSISTGQTATGSTQGTALAVNKSIFEVTTVTLGANGVVLPTAIAGMSVVIMNNSANSLNVYPASGGQVNSLGTNTAFPLGTGGRTTFVATSTTQWYTLTAIYG